MIPATIKKTTLSAALLLAASMPAFAHIGGAATQSFAAGFVHPLSGLDHMAVMIAVGLWAALKGGKAVVVWPLAFVGVMLAGAVLGLFHAPVPFVEPAILASVVALGLLVALAVDLPVAAGAAVIGLFALFHGHAHGTEMAESAAAIRYMTGFAIATALLHAVGIAAALGLGRDFRSVVRGAGAACAALGCGFALGVI